MTDTLSNKELEKAIDSILERYLSESDNGCKFEYEIYKQYDDKLSENHVQDIINHKGNKIEAFYDSLEEYAIESQDVAFDDIIKQLRNEWDEEENGDFDDYTDDVVEYIEENVDFLFPYDEFLSQDIKLNIIVDTGDGNYDFTLNNLTEYVEKASDINKESAILWLAKQQGYTKQALFEAVHSGKYSDSKLLESIERECDNVTTSMNALTFFVTMSLGDYIDMIDNGKYKGITVNKYTACGLYDPWNGAGSILEIELEKDVFIPANYAEIGTEGSRGYSVDSIYGMMDSFWTDTVVSIENGRPV